MDGAHATGVIAVAVRGDDVPDVGRVEAKLADVLDRPVRKCAV